MIILAAAAVDTSVGNLLGEFGMTNGFEIAVVELSASGHHQLPLSVEIQLEICSSFLLE